MDTVAGSMARAGGNLMAAMGAGGPRSFNRRADSIARERDSIRRLLEQANLSSITEDLKSVEKKIDEIEDFLSGGK